MSLRASKKIFIIDDHPLIRSGLQSEIESLDGYEVCGTASSIQDGIRLMGFSRADLLICDVSLERENGIQEVDSVKRKFPDLKVVFLTMHRDWSYLQNAIAAGADGYILKSEPIESILSSLRQILKGGKVFPGEITSFRYDTEQLREAAEIIRRLTQRETEILKFLSKGKLNREIAEELNLSVRTVESHRTSIFKKLEINNMVELSRILFQLKSPDFL
ncbi:DNA-binding response regulator [Leptospira fluminis]|uniref:DNA-binding response regulator n=1 Tax=Leptospira fluminis TaxID=2484979 RepID=A0A4R9GRI6_9LEPT|nr:response regulator transcription factor [Leptospira fluminis]TGK18973.1 DNA-binding response regulator [Leptospira fluminis]